VSRRVLITGASGFAGGHLARACAGAGDEMLDLSRSTGLRVDLLDADAVRAAVRDAAPDVVHHLAARAHVGESWRLPEAYVRDNAAMTFHLLDAVREEAPEASVVVAASSELYGPPAQLPVDESAPLRPQNPYAVSKAACDLLAAQYADAHGMHAIRLRPFNHAGPGQGDDYVIGTLTRQVAEAEAAGASECVVRTGNIDSARDFTDVRDVTRAYVDAAGLEPGVWNVASGRSTSVRELIELVRAAASIPVRHEIDPAKVRVRDVPEVRGSAEKLHAATGWTPKIPLSQTVADALAQWRAA
jgi:GDP-4-dehydro-6-deoxy-D-mannose reductase